MAIALIDYRAGNLTSVRKGFAAVGAEIFTPGSASELARSSAIVVPGVGHFGATSFSTTTGGGRFGPPSLTAFLCSAFALGCSGSSKAVRKRPLPGLGAACGPVREAAGSRQGAARRVELARRHAAIATARRRQQTARRSTSRTRSPHLSPPTAWPRRPTGQRLPRRSSVTTYGACSFIQRNQDRRGSESCRTSRARFRNAEPDEPGTRNSEPKNRAIKTHHRLPRRP